MFRSRLAVQSHVVRLKHRIVRVLATHGHQFTGGKSKPFHNKVEALCCFRGVKTLTAMTILTELGDIKRLAKPP